MTHPTHSLDDVVHQRTRLGMLAVLTEAGSADFTFIRDTLGLTSGNLARHLAVLADAGLVEIEKKGSESKLRTWISITKRGRAAFKTELTTLKELIEKAERNGVQKP